MDSDEGDEPGPSTSRHNSSGKVVCPMSASNGKAKRTRTIESSESEAETVDVNEDVSPVPPELPMTDARFKPVVVEKCLARGFAERKSKVSKETLAMVEWTTRIFVLETICRASKRAQEDRQTRVECSHLESVLPQLLHASCETVFTLFELEKQP